MQQNNIQCEHDTWSGRSQRMVMSAALVAIPLGIWGLWKLVFIALDIVSVVGVTVVFSLAWFVVLFRFVLTFVQKSDWRIRVKQIVMWVMLLVIAAMIWGLYKLATLPYRPPDDMSTFLGQEVIVVWGMIGVLSVVWIFLLVRGLLRFVGKGNEQTP